MSVYGILPETAGNDARILTKETWEGPYSPDLYYLDLVSKGIYGSNKSIKDDSHNEDYRSFRSQEEDQKSPAYVNLD